MKILKWIGIIVALLVVVFLAVGLVTPEFSYESKVTVNAPAEFAFEVFMDGSKMKEWISSLESIENISGAEREIGSKWKLTFDENGEKIEILETATAYEPNKRYAFDVETEPFLGNIDIRFTALDSMTTEIKAVSFMSGKNILWKSVLALSKSTIEERSQEQYETLKNVIETDFKNRKAEMISEN